MSGGETWDETLLSREYVLTRLSYDPISGVFTWISSPRSGWVGKRAGSVKNKGYRVVAVDDVRVLEHRLAWLLMTGEWPSGEIDHRNGVRHDNRWRNLRASTKSQNQANARRRTDNTSGVKGVTWNKTRKKWVAQIQIRGRRLSLGGFTTLEAAAEAYKKAAKEHHKEFARTA